MSAQQGAFALPTEAFAKAAATAAAPADRFQPSPSFQGQRQGFVFTTGQYGTGYYLDNPPQVPKDINSWKLTQQTSHIRREARKLSQTHKEQKQVVVRLLDSWDEVNRQQAALVMFHPDSARTDAIRSQLPLEPALAALRDSVQVSFEAISSNMEDLEQQLERWQQQMGPKSATSAVRTPRPLLARTGSSSNMFAAENGTGSALKAVGFKASPWVAGARVIGSAVKGTATPSKAAGVAVVTPGTAAAAAAGGGVNAQVELLYKIVSAQQDTAANLQSRISGLAQQLELLGVIKTDTEHQGGKTLGRWGEELTGTNDSDSAYGSEPGAEDEEDEYERGTPSSVPAPALGAGALLGGLPAVRTPQGLAVHGFSAARSSPSGSIASRLQLGSGKPFRTPAGRHAHQQQPFNAGDVSGGPLGGGSKLHWVTPGLAAAKLGAAAGGQCTPGTSAGRSSGKRQVQPGASSASSSAAWHKMAVELSNSTGRSGGQGSTGGGSRQRVRATVATPLPQSSSSITGRRLSAQKQQPALTSPDRPASPLHISAATAVADVAAGGGAPPSVGFTFPGQPAGASGAAQTPAAPSSSRLPGKLNFSPAVPTPATGTPAVELEAQPCPLRDRLLVQQVVLLPRWGAFGGFGALGLGAESGSSAVKSNSTATASSPFNGQTASVFSSTAPAAFGFSSAPAASAASTSAAATGTSVFGSSTAGGAVLGGSTLGAGTGSGSIFASTAAGSQFTTASTPGTGNDLFGSPSVFGAGSAAATPGSSVFGAAAASAASPSVFGAPAASSGFGTPAATQGSSNVFGSSMPAAPSTPASGFGQPAFGGAATPVAAGGFAAFSGSAAQASPGSNAGGFAAFAGSASGGGF
eukprot:gene7944-8141_t